MPGCPAGSQGGTGREPLRHGYGLRSLLPGQTGNSLHNSGLNGAGGAAGERCNEKTAFVAPGNRKAEVCMRFFFFISGLAV
ncbi:hypothetical protein BK356_17155 [Escherichia coli]|uniref:Uncharacterized protein n=2 Tax=Enterobacteriaceae TaxID=543 RepID=A0A6F8H5U7_ECOLX|nr:hypothetical protein [Escherichia coli]BBV25427.1 hypothetical protein [Klebsiella pneumoniae]AVR60035.1 hypothetical protein [Escherichia coli]ODH17742.1 hypothetical protein A6804_26115 [Escherichia coli]OJQ19771.1 hypothetical protein BK356_17155 [Escherichia coli]